MQRVWITVLLFSLAGINCATAAEQEITMENTYWQLAQYLDDAGEMTSVASDVTMDIKLSEGQLGGSAGCNRYFGSYELDGDRISLTSPLGSTQMACMPPVAEQEQRYLALLAQTSSWEIEGRQLTFLDAEGEQTLTYTAVAPTAFENTPWQASGINNGKGGVVSTANTGLVTAVFSEGNVSGFGGCNSYNASYTIDGDQITFGPAASTRKMCARPEGLMEQEQQFFAALERSRTFTVTPDKLELRSETGALQVSFRIESEEEH